jgi:hypothetical protein
VVEGSGELADARPFPEMGVPDTLDVDHLDQPFLQDGCGFNNRHRTGWLGGQGGPALVDHFAPGWVRFTLSLARGSQPVEMSFAQINRLVGGLPPTAYWRLQWWSNNANRHVQARAWLNEGRRVESIDLSNQQVRFSAARQPPPHSGDS